MSSTTIMLMRCDRCGHSTDPAEAAALRLDHGEPRVAGWGKITAMEPGVLDRRRAIGGVGQQGDDLCPGCVEQLFAWWQSPGEVAQPAPPPPAPPRPRPVFTLEDRNAVALLLRVGLREQAIVACAAYRDQPTAALASGDLVEAFDGADDLATTLARKIVEQLEANR